MSNEQIAFLGTGLMGFPMAQHLARADYHVTAWNRTADKAQGLVAAGCDVVATAAAAVDSKGLVISIVTDGVALHALIDQCLSRLGERAVWVDMSSTKASEAKTAAQRLAQVVSRSWMHLCLVVPAGQRPPVWPLWLVGQRRRWACDAGAECVGSPVHVGPTGAQMCKLANQAIVGVTIGVVAEAQLFLEAGGVDTHAMRQALKGGFADSTILQQHGQRMAKRDFAPGALSTLQHKDMLNVLDQAQAQGLHLPLVQAVADRYARYIDQLDGGNQDHAGLFEELLDLNSD